MTRSSASSRHEPALPSAPSREGAGCSRVRAAIECQRVSTHGAVPGSPQLRQWARAALQGAGAAGGLVIRLVDEPESRALNRDFRHIDGATNVLSFPFEAPPGVPSEHLGDIVICAPVVEREALEQGKPASAHWAHMVVHGVLHLVGFDHHEEAEAREMESLERAILAGLGLADPYQQPDRHG